MRPDGISHKISEGLRGCYMLVTCTIYGPPARYWPSTKEKRFQDILGRNNSKRKMLATIVASQHDPVIKLPYIYEVLIV